MCCTVQVQFQGVTLAKLYGIILFERVGVCFEENLEEKKLVAN